MCGIVDCQKASCASLACSPRSMDLVRRRDGPPLNGVGIGQALATHGEGALANVHPHTDFTGRGPIVHVHDLAKSITIE
jgi:glucosamine 6-phosphate synthetase-like amidotransferase/phosphosugar isomerase protein